MKVHKAQVSTSIRNLASDFSWLETLSTTEKFMSAIPNYQLEILKERLKSCSLLVDDIVEIMEKYI